jgi:F-type H+-transporting ATPase subunit beta
VLSRKRASEGLFPAIDPLQSSSKMATTGIVGERHYALAQEIRRTLAQYADLKDIIAMLGLEQLSPEDRNVVGRARRLERFLTQPFFTTEQFTGLKGKLVSLKDSLDGCERILHDEFKDYPESGLYMIGMIGEAKGKPKPVPPATPAKPESKPAGKAEPKHADEAKPAAKHEVKPDTPAGPKPKSGSEAKPKAGPKPAAESPGTATPEPPPPPAAKPQPEAEPAAATHES